MNRFCSWDMIYNMGDNLDSYISEQSQKSPEVDSKHEGNF